MANVSVIGAGSWGTALALLLCKNGHDVTVWSYKEEEVRMLSEKREHLSKLPGVKIPNEIFFTADLKEAVEEKDVVVLAVPSIHVRNTAKKMNAYIKGGQILVDVAKGIEEDTLMTLSQQIEEEIPQADVAVLSGPSHAEEVGRGLPTTVCIGAHTETTAKYLQQLFMNEVFRVYISPDILGIELGHEVVRHCHCNILLIEHPALVGGNERVPAHKQDEMLCLSCILKLKCRQKKRRDSCITGIFKNVLILNLTSNPYSLSNSA